MRKIGIIIFIISLLLNVLLGHTLYNKNQIRDSGSSVYLEKIDSLESEISYLTASKDSIKSRIDTVYVKLKANNDNYEKVYNIIINNSIDDDYLFFTEYLNRADSINNP